MTQGRHERLRATELPAGSVVAVLLEQHAKIRELFAQTSAAHGEARLRAFDELREMLAVHEAGEEIVIRPLSKRAAAGAIAEALNQQEKQAASALAELEKLLVESAEFTEKFEAFERDVADHADAEENAEFPFILSTVEPEAQLEMGRRILAVQSIAPTHPHPVAAGSPAALKVVGPFAALLDKARDAFNNSIVA